MKRCYPVRRPLALAVVTLSVLLSCQRVQTPLSQPGETGGEWHVQLSRPQLQSIVQFLAHDLLEGRAPGTRGGQLSELYVQSLFKLWGLAPPGPAGYLQQFQLSGITVESLEAELAGPGGSQRLRFGADLMGHVTPGTSFDVTGELVFVGFGITTELWDWDDYKDVDVRDKVLVTRVNDPGLFDESIFEGRRLTAFGRWTSRIDDARRRGARGVLLIHSDETAGYSWNLVCRSWGGESLHLPEDIAGNLQVRSWIREDSLRRALEAADINLDELYAASLRRDFRPVDLGLTLRTRGSNRLRTVTTSNVVAHIPGASSERIVLSAHIDHLGQRSPGEGDTSDSEDTIYNGAIDNGTAVAALLLTAKALKDVQQDLYYSVTILAAQAEEEGLLGTKYYVRNTERDNIIANINFESTPPWEAAQSIMGVGARFSTLEQTLRHVAQKLGKDYSEFSMDDQGFFFRSDQYVFAQHNIPAVWISAGEDDLSGTNRYRHFWQTSYHTVNDEYDPEWDLGGLAQTVNAALLVIQNLNTTKNAPTWSSRLTFPTLD